MLRYTLILLLMPLYLSFSQENIRVIFQKFTTEDGLPNVIVSDVVQDSTGMTWIATGSGLVRYDGKDAKIYSHIKGDSATIRDDNLKFLFYFKEKNELIIGSGGGLIILNITTDKITNLHASREDEIKLYNLGISSFFELTGNRLLVQTQTGYFYIMDLSTKKILHVLGTRDNFPDMYKSAVKLLQDQRYIWYIVENSSELKGLDLREFKLVGNYKGNLGDFNILPRVNAIYIDEEGNRYISNNGLFLHRKENLQTEKYEYIDIFQGKIPKDEKDHLILDINKGKNNTLVIHTANYGIKILYLNTLHVLHHKYYPDHPDSLNLNLLGKSFTDPIGNCWITSAQGIARYNFNTNSFTNYLHDPADKYSISALDNTSSDIWVNSRDVYFFPGIGALNIVDFDKSKFNILTEKDGLLTNNVWGITTDHKQRIWVTGKNGITMVDKKNSIIQLFKTGEHTDYASLDQATGIVEFSDNNFLVSSFMPIWFRYDNNRLVKIEEFRPNHEKKEQRTAGWGVLNLKKDTDGSVWILGNRSLSRFFPPTREYPNGLIKNYPTSRVPTDTTLDQDTKWEIFKDSRGYYYITGFGLSIYNEQTGKFRHFGPNYDNSQFKSKGPKGFIEDKNGDVWIATEDDGLYKYVFEADSFYNYNKERGDLPTNNLLSLFLDSKGKMWMSSDIGIIEYNPDKRDYIRYGVKDGTQNNQFKAGSFYRDNKTGIIFMGGHRGLNYFHPDSITFSSHIPDIIFTNLRMFNKEVSVGEELNNQVILHKSITYTDTLVFNFKNNVFRIDFATLDYSDPMGIKYKYKLEGFDETFFEKTAQEAYVNYTNLSQGWYTLRVISTNSDGIWVENEKNLTIRVLPPWWKTWWFYTSIVLFLTVLITLFIRWREKQLKRDKETLENKLKLGYEKIEKQREQVKKHEEEIEKRDIAEREMKWHNHGIVKFGEIISKNRTNFEKLVSLLISELVQYVEAELGALYIFKEKHDDTVLEMMAGTNLDEQRIENKIIGIGEGMVGTAFKEQEAVIVDDLPDNYAIISSGLGLQPLKSLVVMPIKLDDLNEGVIEILSFSKLPEFKVRFIKSICETLASVVANWRARVKIDEFLQVSRSQQEELQAQEEELRQNIEEMQATREEAERKESLLIKKLKKLEEENKLLKKPEK